MGASEGKEARGDNGERPRSDPPAPAPTPTKPLNINRPQSPETRTGAAAAAAGVQAASGYSSASATGRSGLSTVSLRAKQASCTQPTDGVRTAVRWPGNAKRVVVEGTFTNWGKGAVELQKGNNEYVAMLYLQPGEHAFRFIVDGIERIDPGQGKIDHEKGEFNIITVCDAAREGDDDAAQSSAGSTRPYAQALPHEKETYSQTRWVFEETRKLPPLFPPHLRYTPLTTTPEPRPTKEQDLPAPYHVTINHMYFQSRDDHNVLGATYRYSNKARYTTVVYYTLQNHDKGGMPKQEAAASSSHPIHIDPKRQ